MPNKKHTEGSIYIDFSETTLASDSNERNNIIEKLIESLKSENSQFNVDDYLYENNPNFTDYYIDFTASQNTPFEDKIKNLLNPIGKPTAFSTLLQSIPNLKIEINYREEKNLQIKTDNCGKTAISKEN